AGGDRRQGVDRGAQGREAAALPRERRRARELLGRALPAAQPDPRAGGGPAARRRRGDAGRDLCPHDRQGPADAGRRGERRLRPRGASRRYLIGLALMESVVLGIVAGLLGSAIAILAARQLISGSLGLTTGRTIMIGVVCVLVAIAGAATARLGASGSALKASVAEGRRATVRPHRPLWQRLYVDLVCLGLSGLIYWLTARTGFSAVVNPDSNPTLSLSVYLLFAPALRWLGA